MTERTSLAALAAEATAEGRRLAENRARQAHWRRWGPYLAERQWGTVREDYSPDGTAWDYFPHDHARSRAYRWGEDGLLGISDNHQRLCFALALWNERDPILKERLFGLTGPQGNHGEDVKEYYFYLDATPTHSYLKALYKYPQAEYPYARLVEENARRGRGKPEFELLDTGIFDDNRYFDVFVEYAKASPDDVLVRVTACNRGPAPAPLRLLPSIWFRNTWAWDHGAKRPKLGAAGRIPGGLLLRVDHPDLPSPYWLACQGEPELLLTENETDHRRLWGTENTHLFVKNAFHEYLVGHRPFAVNPVLEGTKAAAHYRAVVPAGGEVVLRLRLSDGRPAGDPFGGAFDRLVEARRKEADDFYATVIPPALSADAANVMRQALAGLLWSKQWYHYDVARAAGGGGWVGSPRSQRATS